MFSYLHRESTLQRQPLEEQAWHSWTRGKRAQHELARSTKKHAPGVLRFCKKIIRGAKKSPSCPCRSLGQVRQVTGTPPMGQPKGLRFPFNQIPPTGGVPSGLPHQKTPGTNSKLLVFPLPPQKMWHQLGTQGLSRLARTCWQPSKQRPRPTPRSAPARRSWRHRWGWLPRVDATGRKTIALVVFFCGNHDKKDTGFLL